MTRNLMFAAAVLIPSMASAQEQTPIPVTLDNFVRAESDMYIASAFKEGGLGKFHHRREPASLDRQIVIRLNRDTLYSSGVFDLDAGPVGITMPDSGKRFMSLQVVNQDHYVPVVYYGAGEHEITRENAGTRYVAVAVRTLVDPADPKDVAEVHALQDAIKVEQPGGPGSFAVPDWDAASQKDIRDALLKLNDHMGGFNHAFGRKEDVDPVRHLVGTAAGWGGNPDRDATYLSVTPDRNDGETVYRLAVKDVPVDAFWSVTVYDEKGYLQKNAENAYSLNNITAKKDAGGGVDIQFGGCDGAVQNCLPIMKGWNYTVRLYRPQQAILDGSWKFPEAQPISDEGRASTQESK